MIFKDLIIDCDIEELKNLYKNILKHKFSIYDYVYPQNSKERIELENHSLFVFEQTCNEIACKEEKKNYQDKLLIVYENTQKDDLNKYLSFCVKNEDVMALKEKEFSIWDTSKEYRLENYSLPINRERVANLLVVDDFSLCIDKYNYVVFAINEILFFGSTEEIAEEFLNEIATSLEEIEIEQEQNASSLKTFSLDEVRKQLGLKPTPKKEVSRRNKIIQTRQDEIIAYLKKQYNL